MLLSRTTNMAAVFIHSDEDEEQQEDEEEMEGEDEKKKKKLAHTRKYVNKRSFLGAKYAQI